MFNGQFLLMALPTITEPCRRQFHHGSDENSNISGVLANAHLLAGRPPAALHGPGCADGSEFIVNSQAGRRSIAAELASGAFGASWYTDDGNQDLSGGAVKAAALSWPGRATIGYRTPPSPDSKRGFMMLRPLRSAASSWSRPAVRMFRR